MQELDEKKFMETVTQQKATCVVLFSKQTCHICQQVTPIIERLETQYADKPVQFYHVDAIKEKALLERLAVKGVPQVLFYQHGESRGKYAGIRDEEEYQAKIEEVLKES